MPGRHRSWRSRPPVRGIDRSRLVRRCPNPNEVCPSAEVKGARDAPVRAQTPPEPSIGLEAFASSFRLGLCASHHRKQANATCTVRKSFLVRPLFRARSEALRASVLGRSSPAEMCLGHRPGAARHVRARVRREIDGLEKPPAPLWNSASPHFRVSVRVRRESLTPRRFHPFPTLRTGRNPPLFQKNAPRPKARGNSSLSPKVNHVHLVDFDEGDASRVIRSGHDRRVGARLEAHQDARLLRILRRNGRGNDIIGI